MRKIYSWKSMLDSVSPCLPAYNATLSSFSFYPSLSFTNVFHWSMSGVSSGLGLAQNTQLHGSVWGVFCFSQCLRYHGSDLSAIECLASA